MGKKERERRIKGMAIVGSTCTLKEGAGEELL
jgi:hypothetical protein